MMTSCPLATSVCATAEPKRPSPIMTNVPCEGISIDFSCLFCLKNMKYLPSPKTLFPASRNAFLPIPSRASFLYRLACPFWAGSFSLSYGSADQHIFFGERSGMGAAGHEQVGNGHRTKSAGKHDDNQNHTRYRLQRRGNAGTGFRRSQRR